MAHWQRSQTHATSFDLKLSHPVTEMLRFPWSRDVFLHKIIAVAFSNLKRQKASSHAT